VNKEWKIAYAGLSGLNRESPKNRENLRHIRIHFLSPTFLKVEKRQVYFPEMKEIIRALIRRVHILSRSIWKDMEFKIDKAFLEDMHFSIDRYDLSFEKSFKTGGLGRKVELSGFYGEVDYGGDFSNVYPLLRAGEVVHIGARMSYGLGKYEIIVL
jgi:CRISPR-associated endoribonuclease Cas6